MKHQRIAITGAAGVVAGVVIPSLDAEVSALDIAGQPYGLRVDAWHQGSVSDPLLVEKLVAGCTAVIHLATGGLDWPGLRDVDMLGLQVVADAARANGVRKIIFASSNHVVGMHERDVLRSGASEAYSPAQPTRPDSPYGVAKAFGETYCRYLAETSSISTSCIRIGTVRSTDEMDRYALEPAFDYIPGGVDAVKARLARTWLYHDDLIDMVAEELAADDRFRVRFGVSDNPNRLWSREVLTWNG
jgi:nucleoside-diphosphate-sugar epimerase